jgi:hypothetical protein
MSEIAPDIQRRIDRLDHFKRLLKAWNETPSLNANERNNLRSQINTEIQWARQQVIEAGCFQTFTIGPPAAIGGPIANDVDPFTSLFSSPYRMNLFPSLIDIIERIIGVLKSSDFQPEETHKIISETRKGFAFVAMSIDEKRHDLIDVLEAIKEAACA